METLIQDGVQLMVVGMTVVFALLGTMVVAVKAMSTLAATLDPGEPAPQFQSRGQVAEAAHPEVVAAVTAAIKANRREGRR